MAVPQAAWAARFAVWRLLGREPTFVSSSLASLLFDPLRFLTHASNPQQGNYRSTARRKSGKRAVIATMAATLFRPPITPLPTPVSTAFVPHGPVPRIGRRFENGTLTTSARGPDCAKFSGFQTCSANGDYGSCLTTAQPSLCNCDNGIQYLDCVSTAIVSSTCVGSVGIDGRARNTTNAKTPTDPM